MKQRTVTANFGTDEAVTFSLDAITDDVRDHHQRFINDSYWLLFPLYAVWSDNTVSDHGEAAMPVSGEPGRKLTVQYGDAGGYTPGDAYDLYLDPDTGRVAEWAFRKGGGTDARPAVWATPVELHGLLITRAFVGPEGSGFHLSFPVVEVHAHGSVAKAAD